MLDFLKKIFKPETGTSPVGKVNVDDVVKLIKEGALVGIGSALAYYSANLSHIDFGQLGAVIIPVVTLGLSAAIKWIKGNGETK